MRQHSSNGRLDDRGAEPLDGAQLRVRGAVSMTITLLRAPTFRAASATPCAALPALTVQTPLGELGRRQLAHGVVGAANLERADRLQRLELEEDLGLPGLPSGEARAACAAAAS